MKIIFFWIIFLSFNAKIYSQNIFRGILYNVADSSILPYATIEAQEINEKIITTNKGAFSFSIPTNIHQLTLKIKSVGYSAVIVYKPNFRGVENVYVGVVPSQLNEFVLKGLTAKEVVEKAIESIPENYYDSSYFSFSNYRQYEKINGIFMNLTEAQIILMFRIAVEKGILTSSEAVACKYIRKSTPHYYHGTGNNSDDLIDLMQQNSIYHLSSSMFDSRYLDNYIFNFDTTVKSDDYVINYISPNFSVETHGIGNYDNHVFSGESKETGCIVIDRSTYAIKSIKRLTFRNPSFSYNYKPNLIYPGKKYFSELVDAKLAINYEPINGKWRPTELYYKYTNNYFKAVTGAKDFTITRYFEWRSDSCSRSITKEYTDKFYPSLYSQQQNYNKAYWEDFSYPFYFANKDSMLRDLAKDKPIEEQFNNESLR